MAKDVKDMKVGELIDYRSELQGDYEGALEAFSKAKADLAIAKANLCGFDDKYGALAKAIQGAE